MKSSLAVVLLAFLTASPVSYAGKATGSGAQAAPLEAGKAKLSFVSRLKAKIMAKFRWGDSGRTHLALETNVDKRPLVPGKVVELKQTGDHKAVLDLPAEDYKESSAYGGSREWVTLPAASTGGKVQKLLWFHGAGQIPNNLIIRRLSRAFAAAGLAVEVTSVEYEHEGSQKEIATFLDAQAEPILIGGHSAGSGLADMLASRPHPKIKGAILLNGARGDGAVVPTLQLKGSVMDGEARSRNPKVTPVQVMHADHSLRYHAPDGNGPGDKDELNRSVNTWDLNRLVAEQVKAFVEGI